MMVLHDYVSKCIAPLQERTRPTCLYTGVNDVTRLERGDGSALSEEVLSLMMGSCQPLYVDQAVRSMLLVTMPSMDDIGIAPIQRGDQSRGVQIPWQASRAARAALPPIQTLARESGRWCESSIVMMKYHPMMMFSCRGG
jgi:hypothetical protein